MIYSPESLYQDVKTNVCQSKSCVCVVYPALMWNDDEATGCLAASAVICPMFNKRTLVILQSLTPLHKFTNSISFNNNAAIVSANAIKVTHQVLFAAFVGGNNANIVTGAGPGLPQLAAPD